MRVVVNKYHLIRTAVFTSFKPPSAQSEAGSTSADVSRKIFRIEVTSATEYKNFPIEQISAQENTKMAAEQRQNFEENLEEQLAKLIQ